MNKFISLILIGLLAILTSSCNNNAKGTFEVGQNTFLLNGEPFVVKAAELHYPRIPREYWEHRIQMTKALGMNTICLYIFWNIHEPEEGQFDFTGNNDVAAFCRLARKHGMHVIVRPGPYVCAEWEMGGLPWWLLKKSDIKLRDNDPYFLERTRLFMNEVSKQLADLQITRGGNIIMFQVENEYGAYGTNKEYVANIRDIVRDAGLDEVPLFQCDWNSNFENNALDDLLWTINFGTGANIEDQFRRLKELRPESPLMCSEFWSGWFDHWGAKHETRSAEALVAGLKEMLDQNISFSLYMTHGGTSFGHWGGANFPNFSPTTTSYDYDAPINEYGRATEKYYQVRRLLEQYLPEGEQLPPVPDSIPTISIPEFELNENAVLFDNLPEPVRSEEVKSMEYFEQGWGSILYRTKLKESAARQTLVITEANDWTQVFINGERIAALSRLKGEGSAVLPPVKEGDVLDILVEAMGRMNFGKGIYDWKGITEKVELVTEDGTTELKGWEVYNIPVDYAFAKNKTYREEANTAGHPAYYRGTFTLDETGDTFLDMRNWSKGMVWVNGYAIGRYWHIGPQQALYVPGCWLKKGKNEVIVLDMASPEKPALNGLREPILDQLSLQGSAYAHRKAGEELNLSGEQAYYTGSFKPGNGWQHVKFGKQQIRYFCLESLNSHEGDNYAAIAELELLGEDGKPVSRQHWKVVYADSEETNSANNIASNVFDLQESTFWHTDYSTLNPGHPHHIVIDLGEDKVISGFSYLPRPESGKPGMIKDYRVYIKKTPFKLTQ
ncbi:putative beta-galactosidase [Proteiniphilum saccharofermentans]|uniref:Putative beta-galactosidase n=1 Tax=Proteiniphilum saccharofermentans TaxID=1642647 RepID=A0A1R3T377_9BACT|nr:beta-galactosidase [Proteiniphilum saccharofermentans]SCD19718.1 putative beta-galactosidase [Proteiniphilum saccharofermentans]